MYFNIFYKIMRIIDMLGKRRNRKIIFIILIIIGVIFILHNKGYCAQEDSNYTTDTSYFIIEEYDNISEQIRTLFDNYYRNSQGTAYTYFNEMFTRVQNGYYPYFYKITDTHIRVYFYNASYNKTLVNTSLIYNDYMRVPSTAYNIDIPTGSDIYTIDLTSGYFGKFTSSVVYNISVPQILLYKIPSQFNDILERAGYGYTGQNVDLNAIKSKLDLANGKLDRVQESIDSLTDSNQDTSSIMNVDTSASNDITNSSEYEKSNSGILQSISDYFNKFSAYNESAVESIVIPLPYVNKQMLVSSNIISSRLPDSIKNIITMYWWFLFGFHIAMLWKRIFEYFASGRIMLPESPFGGLLGFRDLLAINVSHVTPFMM